MFRFSKIILGVFFSCLVINILYITPVKAETPVEDFVVRLYQTSMSRLPDSDGQQYWTNVLITNKMSGAEVAKEFLTSQEFVDKNLSNEDYIKVLYSTLMNRSSDESGQAYWAGLLITGYSRLNILAKFVDTQEFKALCTSYGIISGNIKLTEPIDTRPDIVYFVTRFYNQALGREPEPDGLKYHVNQLANNSTNAAEVSYAFIFSNEFICKNINASDYLTVLYRCFFDREPDQGGLNYWLNIMAEGYSRRFVLSRFVNSDEFLKLSTKYNITRGELATTQSDIPYSEVIYGYAKWSLDGLTCVNLYEQPTSSSKVLATIPRKAKVIITDRTNGFYKVRYVTDQNKLFEGYVTVSLSGVVSATLIPVTDNNSNQMLGFLSGKYESGGQPGAISTGNDAGGKSYGVWQIASIGGTLTENSPMNDFMKWLQSENPTFYGVLNQARVSDNGYGTNFDSAWKSLSSTDFDVFYNVQYKYIKATYYDATVRKFLNTGSFDQMLSSFAIRNMIWSTAVQFGCNGAFNIISKFISITDKSQFVEAVYNEKSRLAGLTNRFDEEKDDVLFMLTYGY